MKRKISVFSLLVAMSLCSVFGATFISNGINYNILRGLTVEVISGGTYLGNISIPSTVTNGGSTYSVVAVGNKAFKDYPLLTAITIPQSIKSIEDSAFVNCNTLQTVTFLSVIGNFSTLNAIGKGAFAQCKSLSSFTFPQTVKSIGENAFIGCDLLTSIVIPSLVTKIENRTFESCANLTTLSIHSSVTEIGSCAFMSCHNLQSLSIPNSVTTIGEAAFYYCYHLPNISIPASVISIGERAFANCGGPFIVDATNPNYIAQDGMLFSKDLTSLLQCPPLMYGTCVVPSSVLQIASHAFSNSKLSKITIPNSVTSIGEYAFYNCKSLDEINIPTSVTILELGVFRDCNLLTEITIPSSITTIKSSALMGCSKLNAIYCEKTIPVYLATVSLVFDMIDKSTCTLYVPMGSKNVYQAAAQWSDFTKIEEYNVQTSILEKGVNLLKINYNSATKSLRIDGLNSVGNISLYDINGRLLLCRAIKNGECILLNNNTKGVYVVNIIDGNNTTDQKIILN